MTLCKSVTHLAQAFEEMRPEIGLLMREVGATSEREVTFWRKLDTQHEVGWGA